MQKAMLNIKAHLIICVQHSPIGVLGCDALFAPCASQATHEAC